MDEETDELDERSKLAMLFCRGNEEFIPNKELEELGYVTVGDESSKVSDDEDLFVSDIEDSLADEIPRGVTKGEVSK